MTCKYWYLENMKLQTQAEHDNPLILRKKPTQLSPEININVLK